VTWGTLPGRSSSFASVINERGQVVGGDDPSFGGAFVWQAGKMSGLATPRGRNSFAVAINERNQIVGHSESDCYNGCPRAALWTFKP
jgi:uncharacterized membrane protein